MISITEIRARRVCVELSSAPAILDPEGPVLVSGSVWVPAVAGSEDAPCGDGVIIDAVRLASTRRLLDRELEPADEQIAIAALHSAARGALETWKAAS